MSCEKFHTDSRRLITESCLIAADVDKTLLAQKIGERQEFLTLMAPKLLEAASLGTHLAFLTGNSMDELTKRFLNWLLDHLCYTDRLDLLGHFHFFCNSGGVYAHFPFDDERLSLCLSQEQIPTAKLKDSIFADLTTEMGDGKMGIHPRYVNAAYVQKVQIPQDDLALITKILETHAKEYTNDLLSARSRYKETYAMTQVSKNGRPIHPHVDPRKIKFGEGISLGEAIVQITLKPILSFRHARSADERTRLIGKDKRSDLIHRIQSDLDGCGLRHYAARPGGRSSIDVTLQKLDKAYALEFLIDHLNLQGHPRQGKLSGSNAIYLGDEVLVGGGNDYPVTRIPGLLVFAVNPEKELVPFMSGVFVPSPLFEGPEAAAEVLADYNRCARQLLAKFEQQATGPALHTQHQTALDAMKRRIFGVCIQREIERLMHTEAITPEDWRALHAFVTLMSRDGSTGREWLSILAHTLDTIMIQIESHGGASPRMGIAMRTTN